LKAPIGLWLLADFLISRRAFVRGSISRPACEAEHGWELGGWRCKMHMAPCVLSRVHGAPIDDRRLRRFEPHIIRHLFCSINNDEIEIGLAR